MFNKEEINILMSYCDLATRTEGLRAAPNALYLARKLAEMREALDSEDSSDDLGSAADDELHDTLAACPQ